MQELYRVTVPDEKPECFASLWGAADRWRGPGPPPLSSRFRQVARCCASSPG